MFFMYLKKIVFFIYFKNGFEGCYGTRGANDASRVRVKLSSSRVVNISSRARARVELIRAELDSTR